MNKNAIKKTMLALSRTELESAQRHYQEYLSQARLDSSEPIEDGQRSQAEFASDLAEAFDMQEHDFEEKIRQLELIDFAPKSEVEPGAVVKVAGRHFVVGVSTARFACEGQDLMGISTQAPIYQAMEGKRSGDKCTFRGKVLHVEAIY